MSYCLNPNCPKPQQNLSLARFCQSCGSKLLLRERYRAIKPIGQGGFGRTFLAVDEDKPSKPCCVIKQFFPQNQRTNNALKAAELFRQEAVRLDELGKHPQIPELLAHFEQDEQLYLIQEFIDGQNLADELKNNGVFNETQIRGLLNDLLLVLGFVHKRQVIHRDIKPENIIRKNSCKRLVLVDFGAAKFATGTALLKTGTTIGSAEYVAPEQLRGKAIFASDLYSLGATCIHLLTQISPFDLFDINNGVWVWRDYLTLPVSDFIGNILNKMLEQYTNRRYQSVDEVLQSLNGISQTSLPKGTKIVPTNLLSPHPASNPISIDNPLPPAASISLESERGINYTRLRDLLAVEKWKEADEETGNKMLEVMKPKGRNSLLEEDIENFPCKDLRTINQLWLHYSDGRFGFSVRKRIWIEEGGKPGVYGRTVYWKFSERVGWCVGGYWLRYSDFNFTIYGRPGLLPTMKQESRSLDKNESAVLYVSLLNQEILPNLFSRIEACRP